jgi:hypothetical protein
MERLWPRLERRRSGVGDRRFTYRGGGRRAYDRIPMSRPAPDIPCVVCMVGRATVKKVTYEEGQRVTVYACPSCGHRQQRVVPI